MQQDTRYIRGILTLMRVASGLFFWSMEAGLLAFSRDQFALAIDHEPLSASHYFSFLSKRSGRRMPPAKRSALYNVHIYFFLSGLRWHLPGLSELPLETGHLFA